MMRRQTRASSFGFVHSARIPGRTPGHGGACSRAFVRLAGRHRERFEVGTFGNADPGEDAGGRRSPASAGLREKKNEPARGASSRL